MEQRLKAGVPLRDLGLPVEITAPAAVLAEGVLGSLCREAASVVWFVRAHNPSAWLWLTLGWPKLESAAKLRIWVAKTEDSQAWGPPVLSPALAKRLSWLTELHSSGRFEGVAGVPVSNGERLAKLLKEYDGGIAWALYTDQRGTSVLATIYTSGPLKSEANIRICFDWNYGDPVRRVENLIQWNAASWPLADTENGVATAARAWIADSPGVTAVLEEVFEADESSSQVAKDDKLYLHQRNAVDEWFSHQGRGLFKMCTGAGKTISSLAAAQELAASFHERGEKAPPVIVTVPTQILADQWVQEIEKFGFASPLRAWHSTNEWVARIGPCLNTVVGTGPNFIVTTYCTFADERFQQRLAQAGRECLWIADEMHNLASTRLRHVMKAAASIFRWRLGLSATPEVEGNPEATANLLSYFHPVCASYELENGINDGVLCHYNYFPVPAFLGDDESARYLDVLEKLEKHEGRSELSLYNQRREILRTSNVQIHAFTNLLPGILASNGMSLSHTLVYCPPGYEKKNAEETDELPEDDDGDRRLLAKVVEVIRLAGLSPASIVGGTPAAERPRIIQRFVAGDTHLLCAIGCLDEGVDVPAIQRAIVLYSVDREKQFIQRRGRILRKAKGQHKIATIYDIVVLPGSSPLPESVTKHLLAKELRRYREFARLADNKADASAIIETALAKVGIPSLLIPQ